MKVSYNWLKEYTGDTTKNVEEAAALLGVHSFEIDGLEVGKDDSVIDIDVTPNRASDCLCHRGIAHELAAITNVPLVIDSLAETPHLTSTNVIEVDIEDSKACPRFTASLITGIEIKESPDWLKDRLRTIGQRPINNIVDATNYVMFAMGQPLHAYDADLFPQVNGTWRFGVRYATEGESVSLIAEGGKEEDRIVELTGTELLIVDKSSNTPIGLAGVKGGRFAGVHVGTTKVIIEAAHFHPTITRKTARRLGIVIDASKRFENEPPRELPPYAQSDIIKLILDIAGGVYEGTHDTYLEKQLETKVEISPTRVNALLGLALETDEMLDILKRLGCHTELSGENIISTGPFERTDLKIEEDYIEEIGRIHGYSDIKSVLPEIVPLTEINKRHYYSEIIRDILVKAGFSEVITSSFRNKDMVQLMNALASDKSYMRSSLSNSIAEVLDKNAGFTDLLGTVDTRVFEIGTVFTPKDGGNITEHVSLAIGIRLKQAGYSGKEDRPLDEVLRLLSQKLGVPFGAIAQGGEKKVTEEGKVFVYKQGVVEINLTELLRSLPDPKEYESVEVGEEIVYKPFSVYPAMSRDIALWTTDGTTAAAVEKVLNENAGELRVRTTLFDEFTKDGKTSFAFRLVFQAYDRTLTDTEVNDIMKKINAAVAALKWEVR